CCQGISKSAKECWYYISDPFNILDLLSIGIAIMAWSLRFAAYANPEEQRVMTAARYLLCLNFMLYMYRFLEFFYQNKLLGPMLVVIKDMVNTYIHFLLILAIFFVSYCVVSESILYPEKPITKTIVYNVFRRGFWAMMGEYFLEEVEHYSDNACIDNHQANSTCPTADGRYTIPILLAGYVLFVQILMFNLLVALFNKAITENETKRDMIWIYQRFKLTMQYAETKILLPPFLPLVFFLVRKVGNPFKSKLAEKSIKLKDLEQSAVQIYYSLYNRDGFKVSNDHTTKNDKSMETMIKHILGLLLKQSNTSKLPDQFDDTQICGLLASPNLCSNDQPKSGSLQRQALNVVVESSSLPCDYDAITTDMTSTA
ncbi:transient receptor potential cation channel subfamily M member 2, partial [Biomphalaria glabrata]